MKRGVVLFSLAVLLAARAPARAAEPPLVVENERLRAQFDPAQHGALTSLVAEGCEFIAKQKAPKLFHLEFAPKGDFAAKRIVVTSRDMAHSTLSKTVEGKKTIARIECVGPAERPIAVVCTFTLTTDDPLLRCRIDARFPESLVLDSVRFPMLTLRAPLGGESDAIVFGSTKGGVYRRPWAYKPGQGLQFSQPGNLAAGMACYGSDEAGLLSAMFDTRGYRKGVAAFRTAEGVEFAWVHPCAVSSRFTLEYDAVLAGYGRQTLKRPVDWRDGADLYKAWAVRQPWCTKTFAQRSDLPAWMKQAPAMVRFGRDWLAKPERIEQWLTGYWKENFPRIPLIVAYWGWEKVETWVTPDYFPCFPSDEEFRRLVKLGRSMDAHAFLWPSGYHYTLSFGKQPDGSFAWDDRARFDREARPHAICGREGKVILGDRSWLRGGQCATVCPGDPWTIDWFNHTCAEISRRGVEMIQVDQVVGANFPVCYSAAHGHAPGPGLWMTDAMRKQLDTMLAQCRKIEPDTVIGVEEPNEWIIQQVGIQDYRDLESLKGLASEPASVFGYLYHEYLPVFQSNPQRGNLLASAYCLVNGQMPHFMPVRRIGSGALLLNGGFEEQINGFPESWEKVGGHNGKSYSGESTFDLQERHSGHGSLRLTNAERGQIAQVSQTVQIGGEFQVGRKYRLSAWMKSAGLKEPNGIQFAALAPGLKSKGGWRIPMPQSAGDWTLGSAEFTLPAESQMLRIMLHMNGPGRVWIDDLRLEEVRADGSTVELQQPKGPLDHELMRQWVSLFHGEGRPYLFLGKMMHPPTLKTGHVEAWRRQLPAVLHNAFQAADGSVAAVLVNVTDAPQTAEMRWPGNKTIQTFTLQPWQVRLERATGSRQ